MTTDTFLTPEEVQTLTGWRLISKQCTQLKTQGIAFFKNGRGHPIVPRTAIEGKKPTKEAPQPWRSNQLGA